MCEDAGREHAMRLLRRLIEVERWVLADDPRAIPYIEGDAVRVQNGRCSFHPERFNEVEKKCLSHS